MYRHALKSLLLSSTFAVALAVAGAAPAAADSLADALVKAYQTSPLLESNRAALRGLDESVPQAALSATAAGRRRGVGHVADHRTRRSRTSSTHLQAALNASLLLFDNGQTRAAVESARNPIAAGPRRPEGRGAAGAVQRGAGLCRRAPRPGVRAARQQRRRPAERDAARHAEPLRGRRGDAHRRQPGQSRLAASRSTLAAAEGAARDRPARPTGPRSARCRTTSSRRRRCRSWPRSLDEATRIGVQRNPRDRLRPVRRARGGLRLRPGAGRQGADGRR